MFLIGAACSIVGWCIFMVFATAEVQPWAIVHSEDKENVDNKIVMENKNDEQNGVVVKEKDTFGDGNVGDTIVSNSAVVDSNDIQSSYL